MAESDGEEKDGSNSEEERSLKSRRLGYSIFETLKTVSLSAFGGVVAARAIEGNQVRIAILMLLALVFGTAIVYYLTRQFNLEPTLRDAL